MLVVSEHVRQITLCNKKRLKKKITFCIVCSRLHNNSVTEKDYRNLAKTKTIRLLSFHPTTHKQLDLVHASLSNDVTSVLHFCQEIGYFSLVKISLTVSKSTYSQLNPKPGNKEGVTGTAFGVKYLGCIGLADSRSRLYGCFRPASGHTVRGTSQRRSAINQRLVLLRLS